MKYRGKILKNKESLSEWRRSESIKDKCHSRWRIKVERLTREGVILHRQNLFHMQVIFRRTAFKFVQIDRTKAVHDLATGERKAVRHKKVGQISDFTPLANPGR